MDVSRRKGGRRRRRRRDCNSEWCVLSVRKFCRPHFPKMGSGTAKSSSAEIECEVSDEQVST